MAPPLPPVSSILITRQFDETLHFNTWFPVRKNGDLFRLPPTLNGPMHWKRGISLLFLDVKHTIRGGYLPNIENWRMIYFKFS